MATSVHLPPALLEALDRRARALNVSRNRLIVLALERELGEESGWSRGFFARLSPLDEKTNSTADAMLTDIVASRRSKKPVSL